MKVNFNKMQKGKLSKILPFLAVLIVLAICSLVYQATRGLIVTGLSEPVVWGAYVVNFTFCIGLAAGILIVLTVVIGSDKTSAAEKLLLALGALVSLAMAGAFIVLDLGRMDRFYYLIIYAQIQSPLFWDFLMVNTLMGITIALIFVTLRQLFLQAELSADTSSLIKFIHKIVTVKRDFVLSKSLTKAIRVLLLLVVTGAYFITTEVFTGLKARPQWHTPVLSIVFFLSSLLCGISVFILIKSFFLQSPLHKDKTILASEKVPLLLLLTAEMVAVLIKYYMDKGNPLVPKVYSLFSFALLLFLIIGNVIPILLVLSGKVSKLGLYRLVAIMALVGVLLKRAEFIIPVYFSRWLPFEPGASYLPTLPEISIVVGLYSAAVMALMAGFYFVQSTTRDRAS